jgi:hypothetical protein
MIISDRILICRNAVEVEEEVCIGRCIADEGNLDKKKWKRKVLATVGFSNRVGGMLELENTTAHFLLIEGKNLHENLQTARQYRVLVG